MHAFCRLKFIHVLLRARSLQRVCGSIEARGDYGYVVSLGHKDFAGFVKTEGSASIPSSNPQLLELDVTLHLPSFPPPPLAVYASVVVIPISPFPPLPSLPPSPLPPPFSRAKSGPAL